MKSSCSWFLISHEGGLVETNPTMSFNYLGIPKYPTSDAKSLQSWDSFMILAWFNGCLMFCTNLCLPQPIMNTPISNPASRWVSMMKKSLCLVFILIFFFFFFFCVQKKFMLSHCISVGGHLESWRLQA